MHLQALACLVCACNKDRTRVKRDRRLQPQIESDSGQAVACVYIHDLLLHPSQATLTQGVGLLFATRLQNERALEKQHTAYAQHAVDKTINERHRPRLHSFTHATSLLMSR